MTDDLVGRLRAAWQGTAITLAVTLCLGGCGGVYRKPAECQRLHTREVMPGTALMFGDRIDSYKVRDRNGIESDVDGSNSDLFACRLTPEAPHAD